MERSHFGLFVRIMVRATLLVVILLGFAHWAITADSPSDPKPVEKPTPWENAANKARMPRRKAKKFLEILGGKVKQELQETGSVVVPGVGQFRMAKTSAHMRWVSPDKTVYHPDSSFIVFEPEQAAKEEPPARSDRPTGHAQPSRSDDSVSQRKVSVPIASHHTTF
ncbi:MAG: hypothetical protein ACFCD0_03470 [Gemmataceae bacterium]